MDLPSEIDLKNSGLEKTETKKMILKYLYQKVKSNDPIKPILESTDLDIIKNNDYIICPRVNGVRSWVIFFKHNNVHYAVNFPKQNIDKQSKLHIFPINMSAHPDLYAGTIMEGIYCSVDDHRQITIDNVHWLCGSNQNIKNHSDKLDMMRDIISKKLTQNEKFTMNASNYYRTTSSDILELFDKIRKDTSVGEIIFYPELTLRGRPSYQYTILDTDLHIETIVLSSFLMTKTTKPDVYDLECLSERMDTEIAYIPDIETSKRCKGWFKGIRDKTPTITVTCKFLSDRNKWIPIEKTCLAMDQKTMDKKTARTKEMVVSETSGSPESSESSTSSDASDASESSDEDTPPKKVGKAKK